MRIGTSLVLDLNFQHRKVEFYMKSEVNGLINNLSNFFKKHIEQHMSVKNGKMLPSDETQHWKISSGNQVTNGEICTKRKHLLIKIRSEFFNVNYIKPFCGIKVCLFF